MSETSKQWIQGCAIGCVALMVFGLIVFIILECVLLVGWRIASRKLKGLVARRTAELAEANRDLSRARDVVDAMPTTPSGKIQKFKLRETVAAG